MRLEIDCSAPGAPPFDDVVVGAAARRLAVEVRRRTTRSASQHAPHEVAQGALVLGGQLTQRLGRLGQPDGQQLA